MKKSQPSPFFLSLVAGTIAGIRSFSGPAWALRASNQNIRKGLFALAVGEMLADKTPWIPSRISPLPLLGRAALGAISAAAVSSPKYAPVGAIAAIGAASGAYYLRRTLVRRYHVNDRWVALTEDGVTGLLGSRLQAVSMS